MFIIVYISNIGQNMLFVIYKMVKGVYGLVKTNNEMVTIYLFFTT